MAFLLPATFQKRLVRYVLSQLSFLDMASFDLDRLEGAWGRRTTGEIRDIPFKIDKLSELLKLPPWVKIRKADVHSLRLTVPLNIWSEGIEVIIDGIDIKCSVEEDRPKEKGLPKGVKSNLPRDPRQKNHDPGGDEQSGMPSIEAMAQSFVDHQPEDEKARLRDQLAQQTNMEDSQSSLDEGEVGLGPQFSLPAVMADFLWGIGERLKISLKNISFEVDFEIDIPAAVPTQATSENVAFRITVDAVDLHGVQASGQTKPDPQSAIPLGSHQLVLHNIQGFIVSEPTLFAAFTAMSVPPSPTATHAGSYRQDNISTSSRSMPSSGASEVGSDLSKSISLTESQELAMSASTILDAPADMFRSMYRDDDNDDDENDNENVKGQPFGTQDYPQRSMIESQYHGFGSEADVSQLDEYSSPDQSFLEHGRFDSPDASVSALQESQTLPQDSASLRSGNRSTVASVPSMADSAASKSTAHTLPPSQLLARVTELEQEREISRNEGQPQEMDHSVFHDLPEDENEIVDPMLESRIFHDSRSRSDSGSTNEETPMPETESMTVSQILDPEQENDDEDAEKSADDLAQSVMLSRNETQSIYMSAVDDRNTGEDLDVKIPGGWGTESVYSEAAAFSTHSAENILRHHRNDSDATIHGAPSVGKAASTIKVAQEPSEASTSSFHQAESQTEEERLTRPTSLRKRFLHIQTVTVEIPVALFRGEKPDAADAELLEKSQRPLGSRMPGSLSVYDETLSRLEKSTMRASFSASRQESFGSDVGDAEMPISVAIDKLELVNDMGLVKFVITATQNLLLTKVGPSESETPNVPDTPAQAPPAWKVKLGNLTWALVDSMDSQLDSSIYSESSLGMAQSNVLLATSIDDIDVQHKPQDSGSTYSVAVGKYTMGYPDKAILKFNATSESDASARWDQDIYVRVQISASLGSYVRISTAPLQVTLDLRRLDETFGWFGGLSGMIDLSNSVISTTTILEPKKPVRPTRVRFDAPGAPPVVEAKPTIDSAAIKVNVVINGILFDLLGQSSSVHLKTSPMKLVHRPEGLRAQINELNFHGPVIYGVDQPSAVNATLNFFKITFLQTPNEQDLDRLLSLLSPSAQRQEEADDDVLVGTLMRQRRKGGVLRLSIDNLRGRVERLDDMQHLSVLGDEMKKLATVTKYLPEDDRPGVMVLALIQSITFDVAVNARIGQVGIEAANVDVACVTMPLLFLLGVDSMSVKRDDESILGPVTPQKIRQMRGNFLENGTFMPMILTKFIGNDLEPTIKTRFNNLCIEYHVTTIMAAMGIQETASGEIVVAEMIHSVANLTQTVGPTPPFSRQTSFEQKNPAPKPIRLDLRFRDCAIGLNPRHSSAKGLLLLTNTRISSSLPADDKAAIDAVLEMLKVSFLVVDDVSTLKTLPESPTLGQPPATFYGGQPGALAKMGYIPIADLSKATLQISMAAKDAKGERTMDIEVLDELFVLDSCADSTQTMIAIFAGLSPPMPPSDELKYRTEVMPVEDMLNSIVGEMPVNEGDFQESSGPSSPSRSGKSNSSSEEATSYNFARQLGYAVPDVESRDFGDKVDASMGARKASRLNLDDDEFFVRRTAAWDGVAFEFNSDSNKYRRVSPSKIAQSPLRVRVKNINFHWNLYDGFDWQHTRNVIGEAVAVVERKAAARRAHRRRSAENDGQEDESVIGDILFNSVYIAVSAKDDPRDLARQVNRHIADDDLETASYATPTTVISNTTSARAHLPLTKRKHLRLERSKHHKITIQLEGVSADVVVFPPGSGETQTSVVLRVHNLEIFDHIRTSTWKKFATYMHDYGPRDTGTPMAQIEILNVKPVPDLPASELVLRVSILPLRLHVDQDALDFITRFFEFKDAGRKGTGNKEPAPGEEPFIQRFEIFAVPVKLDFKPKRVDYGGLRSGKTTEFMNFVTLDGSDMVLDHIIMYGVSGFERLGKMLNDIWMPAIKQNQLPGVLAGIAPVRGIVNVGSGVKDLVMVPWQEYRKDGRLMRAIQKGAFAFAKNTTTELTRLGARVALGTQTVLQNAEDLLVGQTSLTAADPPANPRNTPGADEDRPQQISPYADQPLGVMAGLRGAYRHLERDMLYARDAVIAMPGEVRESGSASGAARAVLRSAPTVILRPAMGVTRAIGTAFMGATNALDKDERRRTEDKYKMY